MFFRDKNTGEASACTLISYKLKAWGRFIKQMKVSCGIPPIMMMETADDRGTSDVFSREIGLDDIGWNTFRYTIDSLMRP